ncbi:unnamed protein product [Lampetra fluviatilis]
MHRCQGTITDGCGGARGSLQSSTVEQPGLVDRADARVQKAVRQRGKGQVWGPPPGSSPESGPAIWGSRLSHQRRLAASTRFRETRPCLSLSRNRFLAQGQRRKAMAGDHRHPR